MDYLCTDYAVSLNSHSADREETRWTSHNKWVRSAGGAVGTWSHVLDIREDNSVSIVRYLVCLKYSRVPQESNTKRSHLEEMKPNYVWQISIPLSLTFIAWYAESNTPKTNDSVALKIFMKMSTNYILNYILRWKRMNYTLDLYLRT